MTEPEFVRLDGQAVRVTSLKRDDACGEVHLVIVARGSAAAEVLRDIAGKSNVTLGIPDESSAGYVIAETDFRSSGQGEQAMNRVRFSLKPQIDPGPVPSQAETQLDRMERKLDEILARLR
jgi:hypothetical protein